MSMKVNTYDLQIRGLWGRNRKHKFEIFKLAEIPVEQQITDEDLVTLAKAKLKEIKFKEGTSVRVTKTPTEIDQTESGFTIRTMLISLGKDNTVFDMTHADWSR